MKIPKDAKKVFDGVIFDVYQWQQKMYDGSFRTFEMIKRPNTVCIVITCNGKILVGEEEQPNYPLSLGLIAGRAEKGEKALETAKRELLEETGMTSDNWDLIGEHDPISKIEWTISHFVARNCKKVANPNLDGGEKITLKELTFDEFVSYIVSEKIYEPFLFKKIMKLKVANQLDDFKKQLFGDQK